jgi:ABC-type branched-subunit amino acid transport system ATPase component
MTSQVQRPRGAIGEVSDHEPLQLARICIDFESARDSYEKDFSAFLDRHQGLRASLPEGDDPLRSYLDMVWPDGLPGSAILSNTRPRDSYLLRPPVVGPRAASFAAGSVAPAFCLLEVGRGVRVVGFEVAAHVEPRSFERTVSGLFIRSWRSPSPQRTTIVPSIPLFGFEIGGDPGMSAEDLASLRKLPEYRRQTEQRLRLWREYLDWKEGLVRRDQLTMRYDQWRLKDGKLEFRVLNLPEGHLTGKELMAVELSESASPDRWEPKRKHPKGLALGAILKASTPNTKETDKRWSQIVIDPDEDLLAQLTTAKTDEEQQGPQIPEQGFLLSAIVGDLAPLLNQRRGLERLQNSQSYAPRLADYLFDIQQAHPPEATLEAIPVADRLNVRLNDDQLLAVQGAMAAPDLFLIQGPPGTGKTTVIAEICYQVARRGGRVLVASQTNLAVDNALARLGNRPKMRPLRIGEANRVGDEFKEFLEQNVVERWFRGIREQCESRWEQREVAERQMASSVEQMQSLRRVLQRLTDYQKQIARLDGQRNALLDKISVQRELAAKHAEEQQREQELAAVLRSCAQWLSGHGRRPSVESIEPTQLYSLFTEQREDWPHRPLFGEESEEEVPTDGRRFLLHVDRTMALLLAASELRSAAERTLAAIRGQKGVGSESQEQRLRELLERQRVLSTSEDEAEAIQLPKVNRELKQLRGQLWSEICGELDSCLQKVWPEEPPAALMTVARSLQPDASHGRVIEQLLRWIDRVREFGVLVNATLSNWRSAAKDEADQHQQQAEAATKRVCEAKQQAQKLSDQQVGVDDELAERRRACEAERAPWSESWEKLGHCLSEERETPWPATEEALRAMEVRMGEWRTGQAEESVNHQRWRDIQTEWLRRIRSPSAVDKAQLQDLYVEHSNVVGLTCNEAGSRRFFANERFRPFDVVIVDEVSKATPPELLLPMMLGRRAILVGDHRQLPPMLREREDSYQDAVESGELSHDDFVRFKAMVTSSLFQELFERAPEPLRASLWTQYRMHPQVMTAVNFFYEDKLIAGPDEQTLDRQRAHRLTIRDRSGGLLLEPHQHILWIDSTLDEQGEPFYEEQVGSSKVNLLEARIVGRILSALEVALRQQGYAPKQEESIEASEKEEGASTRDWLRKMFPGASPETIADILSQDGVIKNGRIARGDERIHKGDLLRCDPRKQIGMISFYGKQLGRLKAQRDLLHKHHAQTKHQSVLDVRIDTVDRFQGMERPIVIVSLVRAVKRLQGGDFVRDFRRINVALSRAQTLLIIVGAKQTFQQAMVELPATGSEVRRETVYRRICEHSARCGGFRHASVVPMAPWEKAEKR